MELIGSMDTIVYKGVFWWIEDRLFCQKTRCDKSGAPLDTVEFSSKKGDNFNHKAEWKKLPKSVTGSRPYNYYPRGRVEVKRDKAVVYLNPQLNRDDILMKISDEFGLGNLSDICVKNDGSMHYKALLTEENQ